MVENNKLIAEFMGWVYFEKSKCGIDGYPFGGHEGFEEVSVWVLNPTEKYKQNPCHYHYEYMDGFYKDIDSKELFDDYNYDGSLKFHNSWDSLFPVLEKIESLGCIIEITFNFNIQCRICKINPKTKTINIYSELYGIEGVYDCVIQFIKLYNEENN